MKWEAIGIGAVLGIGVAFVWQILWTTLLGPIEPEQLAWVSLIGAVVGLVGDLACGAVAGWLARERGAAHGALANVVALVGGMLIGVVLTQVRGIGSDYLTDADYWTRYAMFALPGIAFAALAGAVAASLRRARDARAPQPETN